METRQVDVQHIPFQNKHKHMVLGLGIKGYNVRRIHVRFRGCSVHFQVLRI